MAQWRSDDAVSSELSTLVERCLAFAEEFGAKPPSLSGSQIELIAALASSLEASAADAESVQGTDKTKIVTAAKLLAVAVVMRSVSNFLNLPSPTVDSTAVYFHGVLDGMVLGRADAILDGLEHGITETALKASIARENRSAKAQDVNAKHSEWKGPTLDYLASIEGKGPKELRHLGAKFAKDKFGVTLKEDTIGKLLRERTSTDSNPVKPTTTDDGTAVPK